MTAARLKAVAIFCFVSALVLIGFGIYLTVVR